MARWGMPVAVVLSVGSVVAFAALAGSAFGPNRCEQPPWELSPSTAVPGDVLIVSADGAASCDPRYGAGAQVQIQVMDGQARQVQSLRAPMSSRGAFAVDLVIPEEVKPGDYFVSAYPYNIDTCFDTNTLDADGAFAHHALCYRSH